MSARVDPDKAAALRVASLVAGQWLMPNEAVLFRETRGGVAEAKARHELVYLLHVGPGISLNRIGKALGRDRSSVSYAVRAVEDSLEDAGRAHRMERLAAIAKELVELGALFDRALETAAEREVA